MPVVGALHEMSIIMTLILDAKELVDSLKAVVVGLESYDKDSRSEYTLRMAARLKPLVECFDQLVTIEKSKGKAKLQFDEIRELMNSLSAAYTKGEINFVEDNVLEKYWEHHTIFQESRYANESL